MNRSTVSPSHRGSIAKVSLPAGRSISTQIKFRGCPPTITEVPDDHSLHGLKVGQTICGVGINDDFTMDPTDGFVRDILHEFSWSENRVLLLKSPPTKRGAGHRVAHSAPRQAARVKPVPGKVQLPAGHVGLWFEGSPAVLTDVSAGSPVLKEAKNKIGLVVSAIKVPGEIEVYGMLGTDELVDILADFSNVEGRAIVFEPLNKGQLGGAVELVAKVSLPAKNASITFSGKPPVIAKVEGDRHLAKKVKVGQIVQRLEFPGESPYWASLGAKTLNVLLQHHSHVKGKVLVVSYPSGNSSEKKGQKETHKRKPSFKAKDIRTSITEMKTLARA